MDDSLYDNKVFKFGLVAVLVLLLFVCGRMYYIENQYSHAIDSGYTVTLNGKTLEHVRRVLPSNADVVINDNQKTIELTTADGVELQWNKSLF